MEGRAVKSSRLIFFVFGAAKLGERRLGRQFLEQPEWQTLPEKRLEWLPENATIFTVTTKLWRFLTIIEPLLVIK